MITQQLNKGTSGQIDPKSNIETAQPLIINGCAISFTSSPKGTDETIKTVKQILLSAYRTKAVRG